jgi:hypothetical protein
LEKELASTTEVSAALQVALDAESKEHAALQGPVRSLCNTFKAGEGQSGSSLQSRLTALYNRVRERLRDALHTGVKRALAVVCSHYTGINHEAVSEGYVVGEEDVEELLQLVKATEGPGATLAACFEEKVVPLLPICRYV